MNDYCLSGDIGGTKTWLQLTSVRGGSIQVSAEQHYASTAFSGLPTILRDFLGHAGAGKKITAACLAVAGPVVNRQAKLTNLPWMVDAAEIEAGFLIPAVRLVNDFEATASGIGVLSQHDLETLQAGEPVTQAPRVVLGAGTGMGVAWLVWQDGGYVPLATEAGHMEFAPADALQVKLLEYLWQQFDHVSVERVVSGPGLVAVFNFLQTSIGSASGLVRKSLNASDAAQVTDLAYSHRHPIAVKALDMFSRIYGAYAGNLALAGLARGGVYIAGGIAPRIIGTLKEEGFMNAFYDKGRYASFMKQIPVQVVMNIRAGLLGAAHEAHKMSVCGAL